MTIHVHLFVRLVEAEQHGDQLVYAVYECRCGARRRYLGQPGSRLRR